MNPELRAADQAVDELAGSRDRLSSINSSVWRAHRGAASALRAAASVAYTRATARHATRLSRRCWPARPTSTVEYSLLATRDLMSAFPPHRGRVSAARCASANTIGVDVRSSAISHGSAVATDRSKRSVGRDVGGHQTHHVHPEDAASLKQQVSNSRTRG